MAKLILIVAALCLSSQVPAKGHLAGFERQTGSYFLLGPGARYLSNTDATDYFNASKYGFTGTGFSPTWEFAGSISSGTAWKNGFTLEGGFENGPSRVFGIKYKNSSGTTIVDATVPVSTNSFFLVPGVTWINSSINFVGLRLGVSNLWGTTSVKYPTLGTSGTYDTSATVPEIGLVIRSTWLLGRHFCLGLEGGAVYDYFDTILVSKRTGAFSNAKSPDTNQNGGQAYWNTSGIYVKLVLGAWRLAPYKKIEDAQKEADADTEQAAEPEDSRPKPVSVDPSIAENRKLASENVKIGNKRLKSKRYLEAIEAYRQAVKLDPTSVKALSGLGSAYYFLGEKTKALAALKKALELEPENRKLKSLRERYGADD